MLYFWNKPQKIPSCDIAMTRQDFDKLSYEVLPPKKHTKNAFLLSKYSSRKKTNPTAATQQAVHQEA